MIDPVTTALAAADEALRRSRVAGRIRSDPAVQAGVEALGTPLGNAHRRRIARRLGLVRLRGMARGVSLARGIAVRMTRHPVRTHSGDTDEVTGTVVGAVREAMPIGRVGALPAAVAAVGRPARRVQDGREAVGGSRARAASTSAPLPGVTTAANAAMTDIPGGRRADAAREKRATRRPADAVRHVRSPMAVRRLTAIAAGALVRSRPLLLPRAAHGTVGHPTAREGADPAADAQLAPAHQSPALSFGDRARREAVAPTPMAPHGFKGEPGGEAVPREAAPAWGPSNARVPTALPPDAHPPAAARVLRARAAAAAPVAWRGDRPTTRAAAAPRQTREHAGEAPVSGTIMIDGAELGRWIVDHLTQAASRPPSGGTAFDPRMTPVWAGASIGA
ncbi:hypothetical protein Asru_0086_33 [Acidisphaera rubrifaciens HS-AP3]|uniref:Uncharacterized protein n=1 Tax=Acidisphaera rubrifaciens HS-AP3 TaxID=1231350 RepID=A0A0D6P3X9_9PROT|nr:hypothetical protein Asru_0086_33 [Acidisphaera rubrifaciens HS-AP3]